MRGYDIGSARLMLSHLGRATLHLHEREHARKKLKIELSRLKKISTKTMKKYVQDLEKSIGNAIKKEQRILKHQQKETVFHSDIKGRIKELETRLARYYTIHELRARRVEMLDNALESKHLDKHENIEDIKISVRKIDSIYSKIKKDKKYSKKQLTAIKKTIDSIRAKVKKIEKKT